MDPPTESIHTMLSGIYDALDPLRELLGGLQYDYPQVMVLGNEKAGKSTLLERLAMEPLFPIHRDPCTKMAIQVQLRRRPKTVPVIDVVDLTTNQVVNTYSGTDGDDLDVKTVMDQISSDEQAGAGIPISTSKMLVIHINRPDVPNIDLMDTPGLTAAGAHDRSTRARKVVDTQIARHLKHSIFLLVISAKDSVAGQHGFQVVATNEDLKRWSIGVITKSDTVEYDDHGIPGYTTLPQRPLDYQMQADVDLPNGYVFTSNRNCGDRTFATQRERLEHQAREEVAFFDGLPEGLVARDRATVPMLIQRLSHLVYDYMRDEWLPQAIYCIAVEALRAADELVKLGLPPAHTPEELSPDKVVVLRDRAKEVVQTLMLRQRDRVLTDYMRRVLKPLQAALCGGEPVGLAPCDLKVEVPATSLPAALKDYADQTLGHLRDALQQTSQFFGDEVSGLLKSDASPFRLGRFPQVIAHLTAHLTTLLDDAMQQAARRAEEDIQALTKVPSLFVTVKYDLTNAGPMPQAQLVVRRRLLADSLINHILTSAVLGVLPAWSDNVAEYLADAQLTWKEACADKRASCLQHARHLDNAQDVITGLLRPEEGALQAILENARLDHEGLTEGSNAGDEEGQGAEEAKGETKGWDPRLNALIGSPIAPPSPVAGFVFLDLGAYIAKATLSTPNAPRVTFYSTIMRAKKASLFMHTSLPPVIVGVATHDVDMAHYNGLEFPLMADTLDDERDNIESLLRHAFSQLRVNCRDWPLVITEHADTDAATKWRARVLIDVALKKLLVPRVTYVRQASLLASRRATVHEAGVIVDVGHRVTSLTKVENGRVGSASLLSMAGRMVLGHMGSKLRTMNPVTSGTLTPTEMLCLLDRTIQEYSQGGNPDALEALTAKGLTGNRELFTAARELFDDVEEGLQQAGIEPRHAIVLTGRQFTYQTFAGPLQGKLDGHQNVTILDNGDVCQEATLLPYEQTFMPQSATAQDWAQPNVVLNRMLA